MSQVFGACAGVPIVPVLQWPARAGRAGSVHTRFTRQRQQEQEGTFLAAGADHARHH